jgi:hypothetical protein
VCNKWKQIIDNSAEIQLHVDVAVDGYTLAFRGTKPAAELRTYLDKRRKAIEELRPIATWTLNCSPWNVHYEVLETHLYFFWLDVLPNSAM